VQVDIPVPTFPAGVRILFLTDMHHHQWGKREAAFVRCLPASPVDIIVFGGDFLGSKAGIATSLRFVALVRDRYPNTPMYGVCGNAEHKLYPDARKAYLHQLRELGVLMLDNANVKCKVADCEINVVGTDDPYYGFHDLDLAFSDVDHDCPSLLITHSPQVIRASLTHKPALVLSGHTHGGQLRLPWLGPIRTQNPLSRRIAMGLFTPAELSAILNVKDDISAYLYISRGLGLAFVPHMRWLAPRLLCRPEVTLITITN
jgi:predicted MPP superfamily phosphohydrolase